MSLAAAYSSPTSALITVTVSDGTSTFTGTYEDASAITGTHFGYRLARASGDGTVSVFFDDFSLATVPEPSACLLSLLAVAGFAGSRRRA